MILDENDASNFFKEEMKRQMLVENELDEAFRALERLKTAPSFMGGTIEYKFSTNSVDALLKDYNRVLSALLELKEAKEKNNNVKK